MRLMSPAGWLLLLLKLNVWNPISLFYVTFRGLDIPHVDWVINYDIPTHSKVIIFITPIKEKCMLHTLLLNFQDYIHRVGRTARAGRSGKAISFVTQYDVELYQRIEHLLGKQLPLYGLEEGDVMSLQERVAEAQRVAKMVFFFQF